MFPLTYCFISSGESYLSSSCQNFFLFCQYTIRTLYVLYGSYICCILHICVIQCIHYLPFMFTLVLFINYTIIIVSQLIPASSRKPMLLSMPDGDGCSLCLEFKFCYYIHRLLLFNLDVFNCLFNVYIKSIYIMRVQPNYVYVKTKKKMKNENCKKN